ncbi:MAG: GDSL-type esterase/lipase family protein [Deltaproteobacteria bacterium]
MSKNRKIIFTAILAFLAIAAASLFGCAQRQIKNLDTKGTNIICFGDSITFGHGANPGEDYPTALSKITHLPVINAGVDSDTSAEGLKRIDSDALSKDPRIVVIEFGGNDFLMQIPLEETVKNVRDMVGRIQARGAMVAICDISSGIIMGQYRSAFRDIAATEGAIFIPGALKGILTNPQLKSDFIHPNKTGYGMIAQRVYRIIIPYLNKNALTRQ